jgi:predicted esterase
MPTGEDQLGMEMATQRIHKIIRDQVEREGIDEDRIVLAGFSQGKFFLHFSHCASSSYLQN